MNRSAFVLLRLGVFALTVIFSSCSNMLYTSIDILRPAKVTFPSDVTNVVLINNSVTQSPDYGHITQEFNQKEKNVRVSTDSLSIYCLAALAEGMVEKEFFNKVILEPATLNQGEYYNTPVPPEKETVQEIATRNRAEGIISLNRILVNDTQGMVFDQEQNRMVGYIEAVYETQWSIHFPLKKQIYTYSVKDTVYWESESYSRQRALQGLPDRRNALIDGALIVGEKSVNRFIPWWDKVDRYFFNSTQKSMKAGMDQIYLKQWSEAIKIWEAGLKETNSSSLSARLSHNIAVAYEITGDVRKAKSYSDSAIEYFTSNYVTNFDHFFTANNYNEELEKRLREVEKINLQLGTNQ